MTRSEGLYDRGYLINFGDGETVIYRNQINYVQSTHDTYHLIKDGETLYDMARRYYNASSLWFVIADVNDNIEDIFDLPVGDTILIPNMAAIQSLYG